MTIDVLVTLAKVLMGIDDLPWDHALYIPVENPSWQHDMSVMILDPEESDDPDGDPDQAKNNGLKYALTVSSVQDVVENVRAQDANASVDVLIAALKYYYDNDAFIVLT